MQPPSHVPSSTPISSPTAPHIHPPRSSQDILMLRLTTGPLLGSRLASWITESCCIPSAGLGFPLGHTAEHHHCSEGLRSGSQPAQRCGRCTCPDKALTSTWAYQRCDLIKIKASQPLKLDCFVSSPVVSLPPTN